MATTEPAPPAPTLDFAFEATVEVGEVQEIGAVPGGQRRVIPILGGTVTGPRLTAEILAGGADWQIIRPDDVAELHARYTIRAADGALVFVTNTGIRHGAPDIMRRLVAGERVEPGRYYFRTTPMFEVAAGPHDWLMRHTFVADAIRWPDAVIVRVFAVR